jgi:hypothetical protein
LYFLCNLEVLTNFWKFKEKSKIKKLHTVARSPAARRWPAGDEVFVATLVTVLGARVRHHSGTLTGA